MDAMDDHEDKVATPAAEVKLVAAAAAVAVPPSSFSSASMQDSVMSSSMGEKKSLKGNPCLFVFFFLQSYLFFPLTLIYFSLSF